MQSRLQNSLHSVAFESKVCLVWQKSLFSSWKNLVWLLKKGHLLLAKTLQGSFEYHFGCLQRLFTVIVKSFHTHHEDFLHSPRRLFSLTAVTENSFHWKRFTPSGKVIDLIATTLRPAYQSLVTYRSKPLSRSWANTNWFSPTETAFILSDWKKLLSNDKRSTLHITGLFTTEC